MYPGEQKASALVEDVHCLLKGVGCQYNLLSAYHIADFMSEIAAATLPYRRLHIIIIITIILKKKGFDEKHHLRAVTYVSDLDLAFAMGPGLCVYTGIRAVDIEAS
jgi:hypothetical protein